MIFYFTKQWDGKFRGVYRNTYFKLHKKYCPSYDHTFFTVLGFDVAKLIMEAIQKHPGKYGMDLVQRIKKMTFDGITGRMSFDKKGHTSKALNIFEIKTNNQHFCVKYE